MAQLSWLQALWVDGEHCESEGMRPAWTRFAAPARDTPARWVQLWTYWMFAVFVLLVIAAVADGWQWFDILRLAAYGVTAWLLLIRRRKALSTD